MHLFNIPAKNRGKDRGGLRCSITDCGDPWGD